jgi:transcriptional regulator GlxA family with amidase domain
VSIAAPTETVTSMNGVRIHRQAALTEVSTADAVIIGSGVQTREVTQDESVMAQLQLDPSRQLIGAQCSGALILAKLNLLNNIPDCTDLTTKPWVQEAGVEVLNQAFFAQGNIATAGGCLASQYLATWILAPVGEKEHYVERAMQNILPYLPQASVA